MSETQSIPQLSKMSDDKAAASARKSELEMKIRRQVACEERAHRLVEQLLENPVSENFLMEAGKLITPNHYQDVTEERAITKICGYPICRNALKNVPKQKYKISLKTNKVYDISERKNFCSNQCYKASEYYSRQIPLSPVWARGNEPPPNITLMDRTVNRGERGKQVFSIPREELAIEVEQLEGSSKHVMGKKDLESDKLEECGAEMILVQDLAKQVSDMMLVERPEGGSTSQINNESVKPPGGNSGDGLGSCSSDAIDSHKSNTEKTHLDNVSTTHEVNLPESTRAEAEASSSAGETNASSDVVDTATCSSTVTQDIFLPSQQENIPAENPAYQNDAALPKNDIDDEGYDETLVGSPHYRKKRVAPELTSDKAETLMALMDKRDRLKKQLQTKLKAQTTKKPTNTELKNLDHVANTLGPLTIEIAPEQKEKVSHERNSVDLEREFEKKLKTGDVSEIKDLFNQITRSEKKENKRKTDSGEQNMLLPLGNETHGIGHATKNPAEVKMEEKSSCDLNELEGQQTESDLDKEALMCGDSSKGNISTHLREQTTCMENVYEHQTEAQVTESLSNQTPATSSRNTSTTKDSIKKNSKMTSASVIDNIRRLQAQSNELDEDELEVSKPEVKVKQKRRSKKPARLTPVQLLKGVLQDWVTEKTRGLLKGSMSSDSELSRQEFNLKYVAFERQIDKMITEELGEDDSVDDAVKRPQKKLPAYNQLRKDTELFNLKVQEFYTGSCKYPSEIVKNAEETVITEDGVKEKQTSAKPLLPLVDSRQQNQIRQKILMDRLDKVLPDILGPMKISIEDVTSDLRNMVSTFHLTSENILLKPAEWTLISYLLLKLLAPRNRNLQEHLAAKQSNIFMDIILNKIGSSTEETDSIITELLQVES